MLFFIFAINKKPVGKIQQKIMRNDLEVNAVITVYKKCFELFFIPLIPLGKSYSLYIPHSDEYFEQNLFSKMPTEYVDICKSAGRKF